MHWTNWFWLFLAQAFWTGSYAALKIAGAEMPIGVVIFLRYGLATSAFLIGFLFSGLPRFQKADVPLILIIGALNFTLSPTLQIAGLRYTQSVDAAILIALEPILTVLMAALILAERPARATLLALSVGTVGMLLLSGIGSANASGDAGHTRLLGNALFLASLLCEASVTVSGGRLARRYPASHSIAAMKGAGFLIAAIVYSGTILSFEFSSISLRGWLAIVYLALFPSVVGYTVWYRVIKVVPVNQVALSLFVQPVFGTVVGYFVMHETLGVETALGGALICASLAWWQVRAARRRLD